MTTLGEVFDEQEREWQAMCDIWERIVIDRAAEIVRENDAKARDAFARLVDTESP